MCVLLRADQLYTRCVSTFNNYTHLTDSRNEPEDIEVLNVLFLCLITFQVKLQ